MASIDASIFTNDMMGYRPRESLDHSGRLQAIARAVFYVLTLAAALLAVAASVMGPPSAGVLMSLSWYFIVAGVIAFLLMLAFNLMLRDEADPAVRPPATEEGHHD